MRYWFDNETKGVENYIEMEELITQHPRCESNIRKANVFRGRSHLCGGDATRIEPSGKQQDLSPQASRSGLCDTKIIEKVLVAHQYKNRHCIPSAVLNMLLVDDYPICLQDIAMEQVMTHAMELTDFETISGIFNPLGIELRKLKLKCSISQDKMFDWLLDRKDGLFAVGNDAHFVGVDCGRRLIFDCTKQFARSLTQIQLQQCGLKCIKHSREVVVDTFKVKKLMKKHRNAHVV